MYVHIWQAKVSYYKTTPNSTHALAALIPIFGIIDLPIKEVRSIFINTCQIPTIAWRFNRSGAIDKDYEKEKQYKQFFFIYNLSRISTNEYVNQSLQSEKTNILKVTLLVNTSRGSEYYCTLK